MSIEELAKKTGRSTDFISELMNGTTWYDSKGKEHAVFPKLAYGVHFTVISNKVVFTEAAIEYVRNAPRSATFGRVA